MNNSISGSFNQKSESYFDEIAFSGKKPIRKDNKIGFKAKKINNKNSFVMRVINYLFGKLLSNSYTIFNKKYYLKISSVQKNELAIAESHPSTPKGMYDQFCDIHRGHDRGSGTCPLRTFAAAESLMDGVSYQYKHNSRAIVIPREFERYYAKKNGEERRFERMNEDSFSTLPDGSVIILALPLDSISCRINKFFNLTGSSSQLSHFCTGVKIDGEVYVLEMSRKPDTLFEPLGSFQKRLDSRNKNRINLFLPVGTVHQHYTLAAPDSSTV